MIHQRGFTLLEVLIVIIIVGFLASIAISSYFKNIEISRTVEATSTIVIIRRAVEGCYSGTGNYGSCVSWGNLGMVDPSVSAGTHFQYSIFIAGPSCDYTIGAKRNALDSGDINNELYFGLENGNPFWVGTGDYSGMNKGFSSGHCYP